MTESNSAGLGARGAPWPSLGVVVPVFNEAATIERACRAIVEELCRYPARAVVIAVDDGSRDGSAELLDALSAEVANLEVSHHDRNAGYGAALRTGARLARDMDLDYLAFMDSDLTNPPSDLMKMAALAQDGNVYIKASRFIRGGSMAAVPWRRKVVTIVGNVVGRRLFGTSVRDVTNGFRGGRTDLICSMNTRERGFAVIMEELSLVLQAGVRPAEFPTSLSARTDEQRASAFSYSPSLIWAYLRYPLRDFLTRPWARRSAG